MTIRALAGLALVLGLALGPAAGSATADEGVCPTSNRPNELVLQSGSGQTAQLGKAFQSSLEVALANTNGCPLTGNLAGIAVTFVAPGGGASGIFAGSGSNRVVVGTNAQGVAVAPLFTANHTAGSYGVYAETDYGTVRFDLTNTAAGLPASIAGAGATSQEATVNGQYAQPLQARVLDADGRPVQGTTVTFSIAVGPTGAGAAFLGGGQASAVTDSDGLATSPPLLANGVPGRFAAVASTPDLAAVAAFSLDNHAAATTIAAAATAGPPLAATVGARYARPLAARVLDAAGQPLEGVSVAFALAQADNGASASFLGGGAQVNALTDVNGVATSPRLVANKTAGSFTATASTTGSVTPLTFTLRNVPSASATIATGAANGGWAAPGSRFPVRLAVTVSDEQGNPVAGATVVFTAPAHGPSGRFGRRRIARVKTDAKGVAVAPPFTAGEKIGGYAVTVGVAGSSTRAAFALANRARR